MLLLKDGVVRNYWAREKTQKQEKIYIGILKAHQQ